MSGDTADSPSRRIRIPALRRRSFIRLIAGSAALGLLETARADLAAAQEAPPPPTNESRPAPTRSPLGFRVLDRDLRNFVDREVCISAVVDAGDPDPEDLYKALISELNPAITRLVSNSKPSGGDPIEQETDPSGLQVFLRTFLNRYSGPVPWLQEKLNREGEPQHAVVFPSAVLLFYRIGDQFGLSRDDADSLVRRLCNVLNNPLKLPTNDLQQIRKTADFAWHVESASPNFYKCASDDHSCGGPGAKPRPARAGKSFSSPDGFVEDLQVRARRVRLRTGLRPLVYILDTVPDLTDGKRSAAGVAAAASMGLYNPASPDIAEPPSLSSSDAIVWQDAARTLPVLPRWFGPEQTPVTVSLDEFDVADHGLFAASIVRRMAPTAEIKLVRVLGKYGVGDTNRIAYVISQLINLLPDDRRIIVNMSLIADIPSSNRYPKRWFPDIEDNDEELYGSYLDDARVQLVLDALAGPLKVVIGALTGQGVLVVAAAGNDMLPNEKPRPLPRFPGRFADVFSVASLTRNDDVAEYSNRAADTSQNGVAVFGGNAHLTASPAGSNLHGPRVIPDLPSGIGNITDGVVGLFTAERYPLADFPTASSSPATLNQSGWAYWSGTSFATPIVSGLAANLWAANWGAPAIDPATRGGVREMLQDKALSSKYDADLQCGVLKVRQ